MYALRVTLVGLGGGGYALDQPLWGVEGYADSLSDL